MISTTPILQAAPTSLTYQGAFAGANPADQTVKVTVSGGSAGFTVTSDSPWLTVSESGNVTPATLTVHVNTTGLAVGTYMGNLTLRPSNGDNYTIPIPVTLNVNNPNALTAAPATLISWFRERVKALRRRRHSRCKAPACRSSSASPPASPTAEPTG